MCECLSLKIFTMLADKIVYGWLDMEDSSHLATSLHFFIEDVTKIFSLLVIIIYLVGLARASLNVERVRDYLAGKHRLFGYFAAACFGAITPFCSCSSIPLFLGFTQAGIPLGITMAFLITSPMINEVAVVLLGGLLGLKFTIVYSAIGIAAGVLGGIFFDAIGADKYLTDLAASAKNIKQPSQPGSDSLSQKTTWKERHEFAKSELFSIVGRIWKWIIIGIGVGAGLHGYVPQSVIVDNLGDGQWWSVPAATIIGIPLYSNASGIIPVAESLLGKGLPIGTTLAFMMSTVAASMPEFVMLKQVMKTKLLVFFFIFLLFLFTLTGWFFNAFSSFFAIPGMQ